jgi:hypothetical protein
VVQLLAVALQPTKCTWVEELCMQLSSSEQVVQLLSVALKESVHDNECVAELCRLPAAQQHDIEQLAQMLAGHLNPQTA